MKCSEFNVTYKFSDSCTASISKTFIGEPIAPDNIKLENFDYDSFYNNSKLLHFDNEISQLSNTEIDYKVYPIDSIKYSGNGIFLENFHFRKYKEYDNYINGIVVSNPRFQKKGDLDRYLFQVNGFLEYKTRPMLYLIEKDKYKKQLTLKRLITFIPSPPN